MVGGWPPAAAATSWCRWCRGRGRGCWRSPATRRSARPRRPRGVAGEGRRRCAGRSRVPTSLTDGADGHFVPWDAGIGDPDDPVDRAVAATRTAMFPLHGLDPRSGRVMTTARAPRPGRGPRTRRRRRTGRTPGRPTSCCPTAGRCTCGRSSRTTPSGCVAFHARLSPETIYYRFFAALPAAVRAGRAAVHPGRLPATAVALVAHARRTTSSASRRYERELGRPAAATRPRSRSSSRDDQQGRGLGVGAAGAPGRGRPGAGAGAVHRRRAAGQPADGAGVPRRRLRAERAYEADARPPHLPDRRRRERRSRSCGRASTGRVARRSPGCSHPASVAVVGVSRDPSAGWARCCATCWPAASPGRSTRCTRPPGTSPACRAYPACADMPDDGRPGGARRCRRTGPADRRRVRAEGRARAGRRQRPGSGRSARRAARAERELVRLARARGMRVIGPNCPRRHEHRSARCG